MYKAFKNFVIGSGGVILIMTLPFYSFIDNVNIEGEWIAPTEANKIKNPMVGNTAATLEGKKLFAAMCEICHGKKGKGDGLAGINLKPRPTNLLSSAVQQQTDGAIYWKITEGRSPMASYKTALNEEQRWQLVNYIRELSK